MLADMRPQTIENEPVKRRRKPAKDKVGVQGLDRPKPRTAQLIPYQFKPGSSGNPTGNNGLYGVVMSLSRNYSPIAVQQLIDIISDTDNDPRVRTVAIGMILERAWGKPKEAQEDKQDGAPDLGALSAADLAALRRIAGKMRGPIAAPAAAQDAPHTAPEAPQTSAEPNDGEIVVDE